jgi:hypothetical protein
MFKINNNKVQGECARPPLESLKIDVKEVFMYKRTDVA